MAKACDILAAAAAEVGVAESPAGSNQVKYNTAYYGKAVSGSAYPWCCAFVWWVFRRLGADGLITKTASCTYLMNWFKNRGRLVRTADMKPGDLVFYNWSQGPGGTVANHIGIVESVSGSSFTAIEGNTSVTSDDNGGAVMRRTRKQSVVLAVGRPAYSEEEESVEETNKPAQWAQAAWDKAKAAGILDGTRPTDAATRQELAVALDRLGLLKGGA